MAHKSDLTEDPLHDRLEMALNWVLDNRSALTTVLLVAVGGATGFHFYGQWKTDRGNEASTELYRGLNALNAQKLEDARTSFSRILDEFDGTPASRDANLYLANVLYALGEYGAAETAYRRYVDGGDGDPFLEAAAREGLAACAEERGEWQTAAALYEEVGRSRSGTESEARNLLAAARCLERAEDREGARRLYEEVDDRHSESPLAPNARNALALIGDA